jgi:hypothetical protein
VIPSASVVRLRGRGSRRFPPDSGGGAIVTAAAATTADDPSSSVGVSYPANKGVLRRRRRRSSAAVTPHLYTGFSPAKKADTTSEREMRRGVSNSFVRYRSTPGILLVAMSFFDLMKEGRKVLPGRYGSTRPADPPPASSLPLVGSSLLLLPTAAPSSSPPPPPPPPPLLLLLSARARSLPDEGVFGLGALASSSNVSSSTTWKLKRWRWVRSTVSTCPVFQVTSIRKANSVLFREDTTGSIPFSIAEIMCVCTILPSIPSAVASSASPTSK